MGLFTLHGRLICAGYRRKLGFTLWVQDVAVYRIAAFGLVRRNSETLG